MAYSRGIIQINVWMSIELRIEKKNVKIKKLDQF